MDYRRLLEEAMEEARPALGRGRVADYIPALARADAGAFTLALALAEGRGEPSGDPFNSLIQLETEQGIPRNPFVNAGALVVVLQPLR